MHAFKLKHPVPDLQPIGSVSLLGATPTAETRRWPGR